MTIEELIAKLTRAVENGTVEAEGLVFIRDYTIDEEQMERGYNGYTILAEALLISGDLSVANGPGVYLLGEEGLHA